jgi:hypothetical protein
MSGTNNPYNASAMGGQMSASVNVAAAPAASHIKDTTTATFRARRSWRNRAASRCWSISGRPGAARASS